jgi:cytochrome b561
MALRNTAARYGAVAMTFHWTIALLIVANLCIGLYFKEVMSHSDPNLFWVVQTHKSIGLTVLSLSVLRLTWRLINPIPFLPPGMSPALGFVAHGTHFLFYFLIIAIPLAGWAMVSSSPLGTPTMYFGLFRWPDISFLADLPRAQKTHNIVALAATHNWLAFTAIGLLALHVAGALWHQFFRRDDVLRRMIPFTSIGETAT